MAKCDKTTATLMIFLSVIIIIIQFDLQLSINSVYDAIIIHPLIYYVIVCLFRHSFTKKKYLNVSFFYFDIYLLLVLYNFHADISYHYNHKNIDYT